VQFLLEFGELLAQLVNFIFSAKHTFGAGFCFELQLLLRFTPFLDFGLENIKLMAGELRFELLKVCGDLLVATSFTGLPLKRANLAFDLLDQVGDAQKILIGMFELPKRFFFL